ncbi:MAG: Hsp20/alpha crystallin family protein [Caulobacteraceae bacterium]
MANRELTSWGGGGRLTPYEDPFTSFRREFDRLFDDFLRPSEPRSFGAERQGEARPAVDVRETEKEYEVCAELPGIEQKEVEINLRDNVLTISGEKRQEHKGEDHGRSWSERSFGRFTRTIPFDSEVDADKVRATCKDGLLKITLPKNPRAEEKSRRIDVRPG